MNARKLIKRLATLLPVVTLVTLCACEKKAEVPATDTAVSAAPATTGASSAAQPNAGAAGNASAPAKSH